VVLLLNRFIGKSQNKKPGQEQHTA
jgi:hypothetical protein